MGSSLFQVIKKILSYACKKVDLKNAVSITFKSGVDQQNNRMKENLMAISDKVLCF